MEGAGSGGGGCCIARYTHHGNPNTTARSTNTNYPYHYSYTTCEDMSRMDRIMLRFRPIAPKPATTFSTTKPTTSTDSGKASIAKRKRKTINGSKRRKSRYPDDRKSEGEESCHLVTLPLLPETPDLSPRKNGSSFSNTQVGCKKKSVTTWLCFGPSDQDQTAPEVVPSSVIVEGLTDTWMDGNGLGRTDDERMRRLGEDTCPGFISDGWNRVWWTNGAYRRMVVEKEEDTWRKERVVMVRLVMREKVELAGVRVYPAFTCRVRVLYGGHTMTVPCDVWRMDGGGFAWRLDVKAALSLSL